MNQISGETSSGSPSREGHGRSGALRAKDKLLLVAHIPVLAVLILPVVPGLWSADAALFGLPRSIVTMIGLLGWSFVAVLLHFRSDGPAGDSTTGEAAD